MGKLGKNSVKRQSKAKKLGRNSVKEDLEGDDVALDDLVVLLHLLVLVVVADAAAAAAAAAAAEASRRPWAARSGGFFIDLRPRLSRRFVSFGPAPSAPATPTDCSDACGHTQRSNHQDESPSIQPTSQTTPTVYQTRSSQKLVVETRR